MPIVTTNCRCCGREIAFPEEAALWSCAACGTMNARPQAEGTALNVFRRATQQRLCRDFHNAEASYQEVLREYPEEHEAMWGLALCRYGVEYVDDPRTGNRLPTVHSVRKKPMQRDADYLLACSHAPEEVRQRYEAEAQYIDDAMARIRKLAETQKPYEVFLCHKTTVPGSDSYTRESMQASEMAHQLEKQGYRVFFAPEAMKGEIGSDYEAAIYHALDTAKVMLLLCANQEYVTSALVRSEWLRFLEMADVREDKRLVPLLYGDFTPEKLPAEISAYRLECVAMDSWTAASDVLSVLEKMCGKRGTEAKLVVEPVPEPAPVKPAPVYAPETDFEIEQTEGGCCITKYKGAGGEVHIMPMLGGFPVVAIGDGAFRECRGLTGVKLPEGVESIGITAFWGCSKLKKVVLPGRMKSIGRSAFGGCGALTSITLPQGLTTLERSVFSDCSSLKRIVLPKGVEIIGKRAFSDCKSLMSITLPWGLKSIASGAFCGCSSLKGVSLPDTLKSIGNGVFSGCTSLPMMQKVNFKLRGLM